MTALNLRDLVGTRDFDSAAEQLESLMERYVPEDVRDPIDALLDRCREPSFEDRCYNIFLGLDEAGRVDGMLSSALVRTPAGRLLCMLDNFAVGRTRRGPALAKKLIDHWLSDAFDFALARDIQQIGCFSEFEPLERAPDGRVEATLRFAGARWSILAPVIQEQDGGLRSVGYTQPVLAGGPGIPMVVGIGLLSRVGQRFTGLPVHVPGTFIDSLGRPVPGQVPPVHVDPAVVADVLDTAYSSYLHWYGLWPERTIATLRRELARHIVPGLDTRLVPLLEGAWVQRARSRATVA